MRAIKEYLQQIDEVILNGKFKDNWQSLSQFEMPKWYVEGRFGLFIHWGCYSVPATESEWYPRLMYKTETKSCAHKTKTYGANADYSSIVKQFKPNKFDAEDWVNIFKQSGAKYIMPVGEHHDGVKMYASNLNRWNMLELNGRDYMSELHSACDNAKLGFLMSNHRAEHYWFFNGARKHFPNSDVVKGIDSDLYGPAYMPPSGNIDKTDKEICATKEWLEDWLASACEMIDRNKPLAVYFDWWVQKNEFRPYMKKFLAYYYNRGLEWGRQVGVFYKWGSVMNNCAIFDVERGQVDGVQTSVWQNDTSIAKNSWGYTEGNCFKSAKEIIYNMVEVVSKNGAFMLNVGPKSDGTICPQEVKVLKDIGSWLKVNGEAIYNTKPFEVTDFEGKRSENGAFKECKKYRKNEYCFTYKPGAIYLFPMFDKPIEKLTVKSLRFSNEKGIRYAIKGVTLLKNNKSLNYEQGNKSMVIFVDKSDFDEMPMCIKIDIE